MPPPASPAITTVTVFSEHPFLECLKDAMHQLHPLLTDAALLRIADIHEVPRIESSILGTLLGTVISQRLLYIDTGLWLGEAHQVAAAALDNKAFGLLVFHKVPRIKGGFALHQVYHINNKTQSLVWYNPDPQACAGTLVVA